MMTTTVEEKIEAALFGQVRDLALAGAPAIAWPNKPFTPTPGTAYIRVQHLPNRNTRPFLDSDAPHFRQGILQLTVIAVRDKGPATALAGAIAAGFPPDLALYQDGVKVRVQAAPDVGPAQPADASWNVPVSVRYESFA